MKKRSAYRPRAYLPNPLMRLMPAAQDECTRLIARFDSALYAMTHGRHPGLDEWADLADAINTVETLAVHSRKLPAAETMPLVNTAIKAMVDAANRHKAGQGMRLDGAGIAAIRSVIDIYAQCLQLLTEREMADAQIETQRRLDEIRKAPAAGHQVVEMA